MEAIIQASGVPINIAPGPITNATDLSRLIEASPDVSKRVFSHVIKTAAGGFEPRYASDVSELQAVRNAGPFFVVVGAPTSEKKDDDITVDGKNYSLALAEKGDFGTIYLYRRETSPSWLFTDPLVSEATIQAVASRVRQVDVEVKNLEGRLMASLWAGTKKATLEVTGASDLLLPVYQDPTTGERMAICDPETGQVLFSAVELLECLDRDRAIAQGTGYPAFV